MNTAIFKSLAPTFVWDMTNMPLKSESFLKTIKIIDNISSDFDQIKGVLPPTLTSLTFGDSFNRALGLGVLPSTLINLTFGACFNNALKLGVLPPRLIALTFGCYFDQIILVGVLPLTLAHLTFGNQFNQIIDVGATNFNQFDFWGRF